VVSLVLADQMNELRSLQRQVGVHDALHDPDNGWLSARGGSRVGERPLGQPPVRKAVYQSRGRRRGRR
jgi:hypothetical protein